MKEGLLWPFEVHSLWWWGGRCTTFILPLFLHPTTLAFLVECLEMPLHSCLFPGGVLDEIGKARHLGSLLAGCLVCWTYLSAMASLVGKESKNLSGGKFGDPTGLE